MYDELLALRQRRIDAGERPIGWKIGFSNAAAMAQFGLSAPLVGFLTDAGLLEDGATVALEGWTAPKLEPEIAIHVGDGGEILAYGAAIELADLDRPPADVETVLAGNVFHRRVLLGRERVNRLDGLSARVLLEGGQVAATGDVQEATGPVARLVDVVRDAVGDLLRPGDVIIAGAIVPPLDVRPGQRMCYELVPVGSLTLSFASSASSVSS